MKGIRNLLLLLLAIISQGAWAQDCQHTSYTYHPEEPNCIKDGLAAYYQCNNCNIKSWNEEFTDIVEYEGWLNTYVSGHNFVEDQCTKCGLKLRVLTNGDNADVVLRKFDNTDNWYDWDFFAFHSNSACYITATLQSTEGCEFFLFDENGNEIELDNQNVASAPKRKSKGAVQSPIDHIVIGKGWYYIGVKNLLVNEVVNENLFIETEDMEPLHHFDNNGSCTDADCSATLCKNTTRYHIGTISVPNDFTEFYQLDVNTKGNLNLVYAADGKYDFVIYNEDWIEQGAGYNYDEGKHINWLTLFPGTYYFAYSNPSASTEVDLEVMFYCADDNHNLDFVEGKAANCQEGGWKEHYFCTNCGMLLAKNIWDEYEERGYDFNESGLFIPSGKHDLDENGVCTGCGKNYLLNDRNNTISFPAGYVQTTGFKYVATDEGELQVSVVTEANILDARIMPWDVYMNGGPVASAPRKTAPVGDPTNPFLVTGDVSTGETYAIVFATSADEETAATASIGYDIYINNSSVDLATTLSEHPNANTLSFDWNTDITACTITRDVALKLGWNNTFIGQLIIDNGAKVEIIGGGNVSFSNVNADAFSVVVEDGDLTCKSASNFNYNYTNRGGVLVKKGSFTADNLTIHGNEAIVARKSLGSNDDVAINIINGAQVWGSKVAIYMDVNGHLTIDNPGTYQGIQGDTQSIVAKAGTIDLSNIQSYAIRNNGPVGYGDDRQVPVMHGTIPYLDGVPSVALQVGTAEEGFTGTTILRMKNVCLDENIGDGDADYQKVLITGSAAHPTQYLLMNVRGKEQIVVENAEYVESIYPELAEGENTIDIPVNNLEMNGTTFNKPEAYDIYKFVASKQGILHVSSTQRINAIVAVFEEDFEFITQSIPYYNFSVNVMKDKTYYIGIRTNSGESYDSYVLNLEIEGIPEFEGTLELATVDGAGNVTENDLNTALVTFFDGNNPGLTSPYLVVKDGVSYKRNTTTNKWGTVILPYELESNDKVAYYRLTAADIPNGTLEFTKVESVFPNAPTVYRIIDGNQYDASVDGPVTIELPSYRGDFNLRTWYILENDDEKWYLDGWYEEAVVNTQAEDGYCKQNDADIMYISGDKFYHATGTVTVKPYRAIFEVYGVDWNAAPAKALTISFKDGDDVDYIESIMEENGEFTDVEAVYSIDGQRMNGIQRGVNIIRTADGKTRKFIKK